MKNLNPLAAVAATTMALMTCPSQAAVSSSASLQNLTVTLIDLNEADGIAPSMSFSGGLQIGASATLPFSALSSSQLLTDLLPFANLNASASLAGVTSLASSSLNSGVTFPLSVGQTLLGSLVASGSASAMPGEVAAFNADGTWNSGSDPAGVSFTLSAHTMAYLSATAQSSVSISQPSALGPEYGISQVIMEMGGPGAAGVGSGFQNSSGGLFLERFNSIGGPGSDTQSASLALSFTNFSNAELSGYARFSVLAGGSSVTSPVPEASGTSMLLAGLGVMALVGRFRRK